MHVCKAMDDEGKVLNRVKSGKTLFLMNIMPITFRKIEKVLRDIVIHILLGVASLVFPLTLIVMETRHKQSCMARHSLNNCDDF